MAFAKPTEIQTYDVRKWVGTATDAAIDSAWRRRGTVEAAALEILEIKLADAEGGPVQWSSSGDYSETWSVSLLGVLRSKVARLRELVGGDDATKTATKPVRLTRTDRPAVFTNS